SLRFLRTVRMVSRLFERHPAFKGNQEGGVRAKRKPDGVCPPPGFISPSSRDKKELKQEKRTLRSAAVVCDVCEPDTARPDHCRAGASKLVRESPACPLARSRPGSV